MFGELISVNFSAVGQLGIFSSQVFQESPRDRILKQKTSPIYEMEKHCNIEIAAQISQSTSSENSMYAF
jgi:hypothetical protein